MNQKMDSLVELIIEEKKHWVTILFIFNSFFFFHETCNFSLFSQHPPLPSLGGYTFFIYYYYYYFLLIVLTNIFKPKSQSKKEICCHK